ncbi:uncharacterized protein [Ptychodera flava]|uniref:uncharacterized protein n=1 Tax=Ptychodera flava TaxID=63121 RepID=UPI00396A3907
MINEEYLATPGPENLPLLEREPFKIISVVQEYELEDLEKLDVVIRAVNKAADYTDDLQKPPLVWKIIGIPPSREEEIVEKLTRSSWLKITPKFVTNTDELNRQLLSSNLVLIPPSATNYGNLTLAAMCAAIPVLYPRGSHIHDIFSNHINILEAGDCVIHMDRDPEALTKRIMSVVNKNPTALQRAAVIREHIKKKVAGDLKDSNGSFMAAIIADMDGTPDDKSDVNKETDAGVEYKASSDRPAEDQGAGGAHSEENVSSVPADHESTDKSDDHEIESRSSFWLFRWLQQCWRKVKPKRHPRQIEVKVRPDGVIPEKGRKVRDVCAALDSSHRTKENAVLVGKQLDQRHDGMSLNNIGEGCISYIMDCQSSEALESLMRDYSSGSLHRMVKSTFLSESLLDEIGALYLSLGTSIDYEEYLLCKEELANSGGEDIYQLSVEAIEEMNKEVESDVLRKRAAVTMEQVKTREKARDRDILRGVSDDRERGRTSELDELINEGIQIKKELQELNTTHSEPVFDRQEFVRKTGAIVDETAIPLDMKQELMMAFLKSLPLDPDKTGKPGQQLVIEGDFLMEYVENVVHDFDIPTKRKQDMIEQFRKLVREKSAKATAKESLHAKQESLQERIQAIVDDADIPDEQKEVYHQLRQVERGTPLSNTVRVLLSRDGKKSSGEVFNPWGLTINQNGHVLVCDYGRRDKPGSVKTVTADTAQILTSVTVHGLPHNFKPRDTKMADNGDYYTADVGNKCIVVSDAKSEVKQIIAMGKLKYPTGVFVDKDRNVFIADYSADCVIKCNGDGDIISSQQLSKPYSLTMNSKYQLIVSCHGGENCIYVLDSNLEILNQFGSDHLVEPYGVTVDNADNIYVADCRKIVKFDRQGEYQETVTVDGYPYYIAVFTDGRIVYSDYSDYTVKVIYK